MLRRFFEIIIDAEDFTAEFLSMELIAKILFLALFATVYTAPIDDSKTAKIISYESENLGIDGYKFSYETSDGTRRSEEAILKNIGTDNEAISVRGTISWVGGDGVTYTISFIADENGFQPEGDHIPRA